MNEQKLADKRAMFKELNKKERHHTVAETRYWCDQYRIFAEHLLSILAQREPVAEGEVDDAIEQLFMLSSSDECARSFEPEFRDIALLLQRTEAERLVAIENYEAATLRANANAEQFKTVQAQLTAERERSGQLVEAAAYALNVLAMQNPPDWYRRLDTAWKAYHSSKENGG